MERGEFESRLVVGIRRVSVVMLTVRCVLASVPAAVDVGVGVGEREGDGDEEEKDER